MDNEISVERSTEIAQSMWRISRDELEEDSGTSLIQDLGYERGIPRPIAFEPDGDKTTRMNAQSSRIEAGQVHLPRQERGSMTSALNCCSFPMDVMMIRSTASQFLNWVEQRPRNRWAVQPFYL